MVEVQRRVIDSLILSSYQQSEAKMRMTRESIRLCIKRKELIDNPEQNERLYLNKKGFTG